jgi:hypothetical protein
VPFKLGLNGKQVASGKSKGKKDLPISLANKCHFLLVKPDSPPIYEVVPTNENLFCSYRAGPGVSPARHGAWATPLKGIHGATSQPQRKKKKIYIYIYIYIYIQQNK